MGKRKARRHAKGHPARPLRLVTWFGPGVFLLMLLGGGLFWFARDLPTFQLAAVRVYGAERVPQAELIDLSHLARGVSLLRIDVEQVRRRLLQHSWIREALVRRVYPNEMEIIVYERRPYAVVESGAAYLLDRDGFVLGQATPGEAATLPRLTVPLSQPPTVGQRLNEAGVETGLRLLAQAQDSAFFRNTVVTSIDSMNAERFLIQTRWGKFIVGTSLVGIDDKLEFFPVIDETLRSNARRAEYIDLSMPHQIVVKTNARAAQGAGRLQRKGGGSGQTQ